MADAPCIEIRGFEAISKEISLKVPSLVVNHGSFCALLAKSGGGKSVLLSVLTGHLLGPWMRRKEAIHFDRFAIGGTSLSPSVFASPSKLRSSLKRENLIYLPQKFPDDRSIKRRCLSEMADIVGAVATDCPRKVAKLRLTEICHKLRLESVLEQPLKDLSGGERKRIEIIARLCGVELQNREEKEGGVVFLLDEPTTGLDVATQRQYFLFLKETRVLFEKIDITFVTATHALSLLEEDGEPIFESVLYVRKEHGGGGKNCELAYCGGVREFIRTNYFAELTGRSGASSAASDSEVETLGASPSPEVANGSDRPLPKPRPRRGELSYFLSTLNEEFRRANGKQFEGKGKRSVFFIPFLVGLIVFAAFLARSEINPERFIFFTTIYAFWIGIFNSCQIVNGAVASGEWNYWVLALRRPFFGFILANTVVSMLLSLVQAAVFASAVLLFSLMHGQDSLFNVFITRSQLPVYFIEEVAGVPLNALISTLFLSSLAMAVVAGTGLGTFVSCATKDTLGALKVAVGVMVVSMISSTTVLRGDQRSMPVSPPLYLKFTSPAPFWTSFATLSSKESNAGFWPHLLEDLSFALPQRYFFNIGRILDKDVLESVESYHRTNPDFEYKLDGGGLARNWKSWRKATNESTVKSLRAELAEIGESLNENHFLPTIVRIIGLEALACCALSVMFFLFGTLIAIRERNNYEIH